MNFLTPIILMGCVLGTGLLVLVLIKCWRVASDHDTSTEMEFFCVICGLISGVGCCFAILFTVISFIHTYGIGG